MAHFGLTELTPPEELLELYDDFAKADASGSSAVCGFLGDYAVSVTHAGKTLTKKVALGSEGTRVRVPVGAD